MGSLMALASGLIFGIGLIASGMTNPAKIKGFLDLFGAWDPTLALVMGGAVGMAMVAFARAKRRSVSWTGAPMEVPAGTAIDRRLVLGGVLFGVGWGIAGFCPGPAIVAAASGVPAALLFVATMLIGMTVHDRWLSKRA